MRVLFLAAAAIAAASSFAAGSACAQDRDPCGAGLVCASDPASVSRAMTKAQLKPQATTDNSGDPMIESDAGPYHFDVYFYGCEQHRNCDSLRFEVVFRAEPENTTDLANEWNSSERFLQAAVKPDGRLVVSYDLATIGGLTERNFADVLDWWTAQLGELADFFQAALKPQAPANNSKSS